MQPDLVIDPSLFLGRTIFWLWFAVLNVAGLPRLAHDESEVVEGPLEVISCSLVRGSLPVGSCALLRLQSAFLLPFYFTLRAHLSSYRTSRMQLIQFARCQAFRGCRVLDWVGPVQLGLPN